MENAVSEEEMEKPENERMNWQSSVVAKLLDRTRLVDAQPRRIADEFSEDEFIRLFDLLSEKKTGELKLMTKRRAEIKGEEPSVIDDDDDERFFAFRSRWMSAAWSGQSSSLDNVTKILSMPFTYHRGLCTNFCNTLQIYSIKVQGLYGGLDWPLDVFGMVAVRDTIDRKLNLVFYRSRDNCQTLTEKDPYLALTGPTRAVVLDQKTDVFVEVELKVRGKVESEDQYLSFFAEIVPIRFGADFFMGSPCYKSKCSSLVFTLANVPYSVEATVFIRVVEGSWPVGVHGEIIAFSCAEHEKLTLLEFGADNVPVSGDGDVELSRQVVSVGFGEALVVSHSACKDGRLVPKEGAMFSCKYDHGRSCATLQFLTCMLEILVAWSQLAPSPESYEKSLLSCR